MEQGLQEITECMIDNQEKMDAKMMVGQAEMEEEMKANQEKMKADTDVKAKAHLKQLNEDIKRPYGSPSGRIKVLWKRDGSLPSIASGPFKEVKGQPRRNRGQCEYLQRVYEQNGGHEF
jgi:hypothetical protein